MRIAVYAGTFDPITLGHEDIIRRALNVFDTIYIAIGSSGSKTPLLSETERVTLAKESTLQFGERVQIATFQGLLVSFARTVGAGVIVRGLRAVSDYDYEAQMAITNGHLAKEIETVFFVTSEKYSFISSSIVRDVAKNGGNVRGLVGEPVARHLEKVFGITNK